MAQKSRSQKKNPKASFRAALNAAFRLLTILTGFALFSASDTTFASFGSFGAFDSIPAQERGPTTTSPEELRAAIDRLADLDYASRSKAGRVIRRAPAAQAVPALLRAIQEHKDGYIRFKSLVLLTGFNDPRTTEQMTEVLSSPNDRLREVAYGYFERHPNRALTGTLLTALQKEQGDFVRPSIVRALAALGDDPKVRDTLLVDVTRGVDHFRSTVIEALGDFKHGYAIAKLTEVAKLEGPLQDDAVLALGNIGDKQSLNVLASLQRTGSRALQPSVAAAICLLGVNCSSHISYLEKVLRFADDNPGYQDMVRAAAAGLGAIAIKGSPEALGILLAEGIPSRDPIRAPLALAVAKVALRNTPLTLEFLQSYKNQANAIALLAEGFDMLEEDLEEEHFFVAVRRGHWAAPDGSPTRRLTEQLITKLDF